MEIRLHEAVTVIFFYFSSGSRTGMSLSLNFLKNLQSHRAAILFVLFWQSKSYCTCMCYVYVFQIWVQLLQSFKVYILLIKEWWFILISTSIWFTIYIGIQLAITIKYSVFMGAKHMEQLHFCRAISVYICLNMW